MACILLPASVLLPTVLGNVSDFAAYYLASKTLYAEPHLLYDQTEGLRQAKDWLSSQGLGSEWISNVPRYVNPPLLAIVVSPLSLLPYNDALAVWLILNFVVMLCAMREVELLAKKLNLQPYALLFQALLVGCLYVPASVMNGQITLILTLCLTASFRFACEKRWMLAALFLMLFAQLKPHLILPVYLALGMTALCAPKRRVLLHILVQNLAIMGLITCVCGFTIWFHYAEFAQQANAGSQQVVASFEKMANLRGTLSGILPNMYASEIYRISLSVYGIFCLLALWFGTRLSHVPVHVLMAYIYAAGLFITPWLHVHDGLTLLPCALVLLADSKGDTNRMRWPLFSLILVHTPFIYWGSRAVHLIMMIIGFIRIYENHRKFSRLRLT